MILKTTNNSKIICNKGVSTVLLQVTSQSNSMLAGELIATEKDKEFIINIPSFGICSILKSSCNCSSTQWQKVLSSKIGGYKKLSKDSFMLCNIGGKIEFVDSGTNSFSKSEIFEEP